MAPLTRGSDARPRQDRFLAPRLSQREGSWEFAGSEQQEGSSREASIEPDDGAYMYEYSNGSELEAVPEIDDAPDETEADLLHPLREAANRVGREVEKFAEALDGLNPLKSVDDSERYESTLELIELYHGISLDTVDRLREQVSDATKKRRGAEWRNKMRGLKIVQDIDDDMEMDDEEEELAIVPQGAVTAEDLRRWEVEAQTWDLLRRMTRLQFKHPATHGTMQISTKPITRYSSERETWKAFLSSDELAMERYTVLKWLSQTADESGEDIATLVQELQQNADRGEIIAHGWLHTKAAIKNQKRIHAWPHVLDPSTPDVKENHLNSTKTEPLVTQLDPDATTRQGRKLEVQDEYFERAIWLGCYELLRRGRSAADIEEWCQERTEIWRAVSMAGLPDGDIPNDFDFPSPFATGLPIQPAENPDEMGDPKSGALWRRMCFALARNGGKDDFERAVYGILSGDITSVEPVCQSWDDFVFMHYNSLLHSQYDLFLQTNYPDRAPAEIVQSFGAFDAIQFHGEPMSAGRNLVDKLKQNPKTKSDTKSPMKMLQGTIIAKDFADYVYQQGLAIAQYANQDSPSATIPAQTALPERQDVNTYIDIEDHESLRVLVHMLLVFKTLGLDISQGSGDRQFAIDNIIMAYTHFLRLAGKEELIPLYAAQLTGDRVYACLGSNMLAVTDAEQRTTLITLIRELGLDAQKFVRFQTRPLLLDAPKEPGYPAREKFRMLDATADRTNLGVKIRRGFVGEDVPTPDYLLICSFEWFLLVDGLWSETYRTGIMIYLRFFKHMKLASARMLATAVSSNDIAMSKLPALLGEEMDLADLGVVAMSSDDDEGEEYERKLLKRHMFRETKLFRDLETLIEALDHLETVDEIVRQIFSHTKENARKKSLRVDLARELDALSDTVKVMLGKDWLQDVDDDVAAECAQLRATYLPQTVLGYLCALNAGGCLTSRSYLLEGLDLATVIAAAADARADGGGQPSDLAQLFVATGYMPTLVEAFARLSKAVLRINESQKGSTARDSSKKLRERGWSRNIWNVAK